MTVLVSDIETALGRTLTVEESALADQLIGDALVIIEARLGDPALLNQDRLNLVVREAVVARFRNPEGYASETIDDYTYRLPSETRRITILPEWWALLKPRGRGRAYSVMPS